MQKEILKGMALQKNVRFGKPVITGTRVPVDLIVGKIAGGMAVEEIMREYDLTRRQVHNALRYAATIVAQEEVALT